MRLRLPQFLRQGLANLYRPGNQSSAVLAALGTGVMLILSVYLMQAQVLRDIQETASPTLPNIFLVDITSDEVAGITAFFKKQPGVLQQLDLLPVISGRFLSINGTPLDKVKIDHFPKRMLESVSMSWADALPAGDKLIQGRWWSDVNAHEIAINEGTSNRIHLGVGSTVEIEIDGRALPLKVTAVFRADEQHIASRSGFFLPSGLVKDAPVVWYGAARVDIHQVSPVERALFEAYPTVTVINLADVLDRIESVVRQITFVVRFLAGFSIFAGLMILASSIASTRFRRTREAVVLKTLGATRGRIIKIFSVEFSVLGLLAGACRCRVCKSADAHTAEQTRSSLAHGVGSHARRAHRHCTARDRNRLARQLSHPRLEATRSASRGVANRGFDGTWLRTADPLRLPAALIQGAPASLPPAPR